MHILAEKEEMFAACKGSLAERDSTICALKNEIHGLGSPSGGIPGGAKAVADLTIERDRLAARASQAELHGRHRFGLAQDRASQITHLQSSLAQKPSEASELRERADTLERSQKPGGSMDTKLRALMKAAAGRYESHLADVTEYESKIRRQRQTISEMSAAKSRKSPRNDSAPTAADPFSLDDFASSCGIKLPPLGKE